MKQIYIFLLLLFIYSSPVIASSNLTITCNNSSCDKSSNEPLFAESNIYPSFTVTQKTTITNTKNSNCQLSFKISSLVKQNPLASSLTLSATQNGQIWYSGLLSSLYDKKSHSLGTVPAKSSNDILWTVNFNQDASNELQNTTTTFDTDLIFTCDDDSPPTCHDSVPNFYPLNFKAIADVNSAILFWDRPSGTFGYYLISYGDTPTADQFVNQNIGGPDTVSHVVTGLSGGKKYYFKIKVGNGCAPGLFSPVISLNAQGEIYERQLVSSGFYPESNSVLGVSDTKKTTPVLQIKYVSLFLLLVVFVLFVF